MVYINRYNRIFEGEKKNQWKLEKKMHGRSRFKLSYNTSVLQGKAREKGPPCYSSITALKNWNIKEHRRQVSLCSLSWTCINSKLLFSLFYFLASLVLSSLSLPCSFIGTTLGSYIPWQLYKDFFYSPVCL